MLIHPTLDKLQTLKCTGMAAALTEQMSVPDIDTLSFEERLGLLVDREITERDNRRLSNRLRCARLKHNATLEDIDYRHPRGLDKSLMQSLATCQWVREHLNILITGPTGVGKTWLACALAHNACRHGYTALYLRLPRLLQDLTIAKGDGRYPKLVDPEKPDFRLPLWVPVAEPDQPAFGSTVCRRLTDALRAPTRGAKPV